jgi:lysophospholipase L1-like esterase
MLLTSRPGRLFLASLLFALTAGGAAVAGNASVSPVAGATATESASVSEAFECPRASILKGELHGDALKRRLSKAQPAYILAIGSSSTEGIGASSKAATYPAQLQDQLRAAWPGMTVSVENAGVGGEKAGATLDRMAARLASAHFDLVLWQVGTNDAVAGGDIAGFRELLKRGIAEARAAKVEIALLDQQYYPGIRDVPAYERFVGAVTEVAAQEHVPVFSRYGLMKNWNAENRLLPALSGDRFHMSDKGYGCLARLVGEDIGRVVGPPRSFPVAGRTQELPGL